MNLEQLKQSIKLCKIYDDGEIKEFKIEPIEIRFAEKEPSNDVNKKDEFIGRLRNSVEFIENLIFFVDECDIDGDWYIGLCEKLLEYYIKEIVKSSD